MMAKNRQEGCASLSDMPVVEEVLSISQNGSNSQAQLESAGFDTHSKVGKDGPVTGEREGLAQRPRDPRDPEKALDLATTAGPVKRKDAGVEDQQQGLNQSLGASTRSATPELKDNAPAVSAQQAQVTPPPGVEVSYVPVFENALVWQKRDVAPPWLSKQVITPQLWAAKDTHLDMRIFVHNLAFDKDVFVRYSEDGWASFKDVPASFCKQHIPTQGNGSPGPPTDIFLVRLPVEPRSHTIELCFGYAVGGHTHWNNNDGENFRLCITEVPESVARVFEDNITTHEECAFCMAVNTGTGTCPVCLAVDLLFPSVSRWSPESWTCVGCPEKHKACRQCLFRWYAPQILEGAKHLRCIGGCDTKVMTPDVHIVDRLLGCLFMHNQRVSHTDHLKEMKADKDLSRWLQDNTTVCPSCDLPVEREEGCNAMLCHCGAAFCFGCGQLLDCDCSEEEDEDYLY